MDISKLDTFTQAYITCALWSSTDGDEESLEDYELAPATLESMAKDCEDFQDSQAGLLEHWYNECGEDSERAGHDFWLTRNGHGAGFWDRWAGSTPQGKIGDALTKAAKVYGSVDLYLGDDELVYSN